MLLDLLVGFAQYAVAPPREVWDFRRHAYVVKEADRWRAAMLQWPDEPWGRGSISFEDRRAEAAWNANGARCLGDLLPERFADLRVAIRRRFKNP